MKNFNRIILFMVSIILAVSGAMFWLSHEKTEKKMDQKIANIKMKPICFGRFLIEVPQDAEVTFRSSSVGGWDILSIEESNEDFINRLKKKEDFLSVEKNELGGLSLEVFEVIKNDRIEGALFMFDRRRIKLRRSGNEVISETVSIDALVRSNGVSYEFYGKLRRPAHLDQLKRIVNQLQHRSADAAPGATGFCFNHGFINEPLGPNQNEYTSIFLGLKNYPDLAIAFSTSAGIEIDETLLQRNSENQIQKEFSSHFQRIRIGSRALNGIPGEEVLQRVDEKNGVKVHDFMWESLTNKNDVYLPSIILELETGIGRPGNPVNSSLSDIEALFLWDKISSSLRRRPLGAAEPALNRSKEN